LLVKPAEFLSKAALAFSRRPEPTARYHSIAQKIKALAQLANEAFAAVWQVQGDGTLVD
jgi:hypothetical protein